MAFDGTMNARTSCMLHTCVAKGLVLCQLVFQQASN